MRTFDCTEAQVRLNECGEGEYVRREVAERLLAALKEAILWDSFDEYGVNAVWLDSAESALEFADQN